jgi:hypothetical protein
MKVRVRFLLSLLTGAWLALAGCSRTPSEAGSAPADAAARATLDARTRGWELGQWYAYHLKLTSAVSFGAGANAFDFDLEGLVQITPTEVTPEMARLYVGVANPHIVSRTAGSQPEFDKVAEQIKGTGCFFTLSGGRVKDMYAPRGLSAIAANTYREIAAALQFARTVPSTDRYTAEEYDTTGQYVAEYQLDHASGVWNKRKLRYGRRPTMCPPRSCRASIAPKGRFAFLRTDARK